MADNRLIPELVCSDIGRTLAFYRDVLGFTVRFERPEERFAFLELEGAQLMVEQPRGRSRSLATASLERPYGRGMNLQIEVAEVRPLWDRVVAADAVVPIPLEERWYRRGELEAGNHQFVVADPDGYLLRFFQDLGQRAVQR